MMRGLYLQYAEEEASNLTKSFWFGKFLQTLSEDELLNCREESQHTQPEHEQFAVSQSKHEQFAASQSEQEQFTVSQQSEGVMSSTQCRCGHKSSVYERMGRAKEPLWVHVERAEECLRTRDSSLSPLVHRLVVDSMKETHTLTTSEPPSLERVALPSLAVLKEDLTLEWSVVAAFLGKDAVCGGDYSMGAERCAALASHVCQALTSQPHSGLWQELFAWTGNEQVFSECVELLRSSSDVSVVHTHLSVLLCSAVLERVLGDVYLTLSRASQCPSLLRDLLFTRELEEAFGATAMCCLRCLIGPPSGLNLRNVLWHGFPAPGEISPNYGYLLLAIAASLGRAVASSSLEIVHRKPLSLLQQETVIAGTFPELCGEDMVCIGKLFSSSFFILPSMLPQWLAGLTAFTQERYHHCLVLLLPGLEHGLRRVFACVNHCPHRALTAESTVLYTTFDEILSPVLPDNTNNELTNEIGSAKMECLLDLLIHPEGPRLRDRISHGEVDFLSLSKCMASYLISLLVLLSAQYSLDHSLLTEPVIAKCLAVEKCYASLFHPLSLLRRELLQVAECLESWSILPLPPHPNWSQRDDQWPPPSTSQPDTVSRPHSLTDFSAAVKRLVETLSDCGQLHVILQQVSSIDYSAAVTESGHISTALRGLVVQVWSGLRVGTLHCGRGQLELTGIMRRTTENATRTASQVRDRAVLRYEQHQKKQLRSRQRKNYEHLLTSLPLYRAALCLLVVNLVATASHLYSLTERETTTKKATKFHKRVLQLSENLSSQTSSSKNRWEEADQLAHSLTQLSLPDIF